jgi:two-component system response regulator NreC
MDALHLRLAPALSNSGFSEAQEGPIRVVLADGHALMRRSLRLLLDGEHDVEVIAEAVDIASVTRHVRGRQPHVLVLDLGMPDGSSSEAIGQLRERAPETQIVVVTMEENPVFAQRALAAGAVGFVMKELADEELPNAIRRAARGEQHVSPRVVAQLGRYEPSAHGGQADRPRDGGTALDRAWLHERRDIAQAAPVAANG